MTTLTAAPAARIDDNIADRAMAALWQDGFLDPTGMEIGVANEIVTLAGMDIEPYQAARALALLDDLVGVAGVRDGTMTTLRQAA